MPMADALDVMGMSHAGTNTLTDFHNREPSKPLVATECCSCGSQRGEDADLQSEWGPNVFYSGENSECLSSQTTRSDTVPWVAGTFVWTAIDYIVSGGEQRVAIVGASATSPDAHSAAARSPFPRLSPIANPRARLTTGRR